jgi:hypothetical protein
MSSQISETELYAPVKAFLEAQGYEVKAEVGPADVMALRDGGPPVIVELKTGFSLALFHQGIARLRSATTSILRCRAGRGGDSSAHWPRTRGWRGGWGWAS